MIISKKTKPISSFGSLNEVKSPINGKYKCRTYELPLSREDCERKFINWTKLRREYPFSGWRKGVYIIVKFAPRARTWIPFFNIWLPCKIIYVGTGTLFYDEKKSFRLRSRAHQRHYEELDELIVSNPNRYKILVAPGLLLDQANSLEGELIKYYHDVVGLEFFKKCEKGKPFFYNKNREDEICERSKDYINLEEFRHENCKTRQE